MTLAAAPLVLVVEDDDSARRLLRMGLELEGVTVIEAPTLKAARAGLRPDVHGVVLDRELPDGDGLELLADIGATNPEAAIVVNSTKDDGREPAWMTRVTKGDLPAIVAALELPARARPDPRDEHLAVIDLVRIEAGDLVRDWAELCRWDPQLPPDASPPLAARMVGAVGDSLSRPQPLGWGPDPALEEAAEAFAEEAGPLDTTVGLLICLRETLRRHIAGHVPPAEEAETRDRVDMAIDRAIWIAARVAGGRVGVATPGR